MQPTHWEPDPPLTKEQIAARAERARERRREEIRQYKRAAGLIIAYLLESEQPRSWTAVREHLETEHDVPQSTTVGMLHELISAHRVRWRTDGRLELRDGWERLLPFYDDQGREV